MINKPQRLRAAARHPYGRPSSLLEGRSLRRRAKGDAETRSFRQTYSCERGRLRCDRPSRSSPSRALLPEERTRPALRDEIPLLSRIIVVTDADDAMIVAIHTGNAMPSGVARLLLGTSRRDEFGNQCDCSVRSPSRMLWRDVPFGARPDSLWRHNSIVFRAPARQPKRALPVQGSRARTTASTLDRACIFSRTW